MEDRDSKMEQGEHYSKMKRNEEQECATDLEMTIKTNTHSESTSDSQDVPVRPGPIQLSVIPTPPVAAGIRSGANLTSSTPLRDIWSLTPGKLIDVESGKLILVKHHEDDEPHGKRRFLVVTAKTSAPNSEKMCLLSIKEHNKSIVWKDTKTSLCNFQINSEVGIVGGAWRGFLKRVLLWTYDKVNAMRLSRALQLFLPFLTGFEAYILGQVIEALDSGRRKDIRCALSVAFRNRNVSRILVQQVGPRHDFLWHWSTMITWNRAFDAWGQLPLLGITAFPPSENFPSTRNHALASIFRVVLGEGNWLTRVITRGREGLVTDNPEATAQNLAAESNGFELANRNQFGTYFGRQKTNDFRFAHRLPTDESIVRTFVAQPMPTLLNNGVVHVLRQLAKHWHNMLDQQNFAHQRMEQLDPFETLRFHMPVVLLTLSTLRGRNKWDSRVLGPMVKKLQGLTSSFTADKARLFARELKAKVAVNVCGGVPSVWDPLWNWLDAIHRACVGIEAEAKKIYELISAVELGIQIGHDVLSRISWKIPQNKKIEEAILNHIRGLRVNGVSETRIRTALTKITPRDKRTLIELVKRGFETSRPAQLLLGRAKTLLQREIRRDILNQTIRGLSKGDYVSTVKKDEWYWIENGAKATVCICEGTHGSDQHRFVHAYTNTEILLSLDDPSIRVRSYVPIAEAIVRAQRAFLVIELDHGARYSLNAFMEFSYLRNVLRKLVVVSQMVCEELDNARLNVLSEIQHSPNRVEVSCHDELTPGTTYYIFDSQNTEYVPFVCKDPLDDWHAAGEHNTIVRIPPQSMIVIGGGPTGLVTCIHCCENVLASGGEMKLYEARDAFASGGSTFERAQIVRLDARWIAMLRYYIGTGFEDTYVPASGETDAQLGNTLPSQGFVEITIKDLEYMLNVEISRMWSKGLIQVHTGTQAMYDPESNSLRKTGQHLKLEDVFLRQVDENGHFTDTEHHRWKVVKLIYTRSLSLDEIKVGRDFGIYVRAKNAILPYRLLSVDLETSVYKFVALYEDGIDIQAAASDLPSVYPSSTREHVNVDKLIVECTTKGVAGNLRQELWMCDIKDDWFSLCTRHTHVVEAVGKPHHSKVHFRVTTPEPYGVCCVQGLKISMGMHNFGETRWGGGILDDLRSHGDFNTRVIGDFTKMVRSAPVAAKMLEYMSDTKDTNWQLHFDNLVATSAFPQLGANSRVSRKIREACAWLADNAETFKRQTLQTRFFETGDNYYMGMEFGREYDFWKRRLADGIVSPQSRTLRNSTNSQALEKFRGDLMHHIDRLWYEGVLEVIRHGDVYNPGARHRVPRLYLINAMLETPLSKLPVGESFRLSDDPEEKYEILIKRMSTTVVRNVEGRLSKMKNSIAVKREGNLTRSPDGNSESRVSLATFPVTHYVNFRTMRANNSGMGYVFAFIGDEQATPHFMRYSGLTGACINAMSLNNFIRQAIDGVPFTDRLRSYSVETNWCNGEVVQRGTGANYGKDGFLRPGFTYEHAVDYLHSKVLEYQESQQSLDSILTRDWLIKFSASMIPCGMEQNENFTTCLRSQLREAIFVKLLKELRLETDADGGRFTKRQLKERRATMSKQRQVLSINAYWDEFLDGLSLDDSLKSKVSEHIFVANRLEHMFNQVIDFARKANLYNERISSELFNQPKPVDSIVDDFAVEAQNFANSLATSTAFAAGALAFRLMDAQLSNIFSSLLAAFNIVISFGTMTESSRYKIRNEEMRTSIADEKLLGILKVVYSMMDQVEQASVPSTENPFLESLEKQVTSFRKIGAYYEVSEPVEFEAGYARLKDSINSAEEIRAFRDLLSTKVIVLTYQENSYVQEYLVDIYRTLDEMYNLLSRNMDRTSHGGEVACLFRNLMAFRPKLECSLQRGATRFGFVKRRRFSQWDAVVVFKYFWSFLCRSSRHGSCPTAPISTTTLGVVQHLSYVSSLYDSKMLRRELRDMESLYWATRESDVGSLLFMSGFIVFVTSIFFTIVRLFDIRVLEEFAFWAVAASSFGAFLATSHFLRKLWILVRLMFVLVGKARQAKNSDTRGRNIHRVLALTVTQIVLTLLRLVASAAAAVALPWSVAEQAFGEHFDGNGDLPFWIALGAVSMALTSIIMFSVVEFVLRYNLNPKLGEFTTESFRDEIEAMYRSFLRPFSPLESSQVQKRENWEYAAREFLHCYRFDTVFAADRFGSILQYIQSGMDPSSNEI